jgi:hypothetical protein
MSNVLSTKTVYLADHVVEIVIRKQGRVLRRWVIKRSDQFIWRFAMRIIDDAYACGVVIHAAGIGKITDPYFVDELEQLADNYGAMIGR